MLIRVLKPEHWYMVDSSCVVRDNDWRQLRQLILERDNFTCQYCGDKDGPFEVDHIMPKFRGGTDSKSNLLCACRTCNRSKRDRTPEEWIESMG